MNNIDDTCLKRKQFIVSLDKNKFEKFINLLSKKDFYYFNYNVIKIDNLNVKEVEDTLILNLKFTFYLRSNVDYEDFLTECFISNSTDDKYIGLETITLLHFLIQDFCKGISKDNPIRISQNGIKLIAYIQKENIDYFDPKNTDYLEVKKLLDKGNSISLNIKIPKAFFEISLRSLELPTYKERNDDYWGIKEIVDDFTNDKSIVLKILDDNYCPKVWLKLLVLSLCKQIGIAFSFST